MSRNGHDMDLMLEGLRFGSGAPRASPLGAAQVPQQGVTVIDDRVVAVDAAAQRRPRMSSGASAGPAPRASAVPRMSPAPAPAPVSRPSLARAASEATGAADRVGIPGFWRSIMADVVPPPGTRALGTAPGGATRDHATHHHHHHHHHHQHPPHPLSGRAIARSHTDGPGKMGSRLGHAGESAVLARLREPWPREGGGAGRDPQPLQSLRRGEGEEAVGRSEEEGHGKGPGAAVGGRDSGGARAVRPRMPGGDVDAATRGVASTGDAVMGKRGPPPWPDRRTDARAPSAPATPLPPPASPHPLPPPRPRPSLKAYASVAPGYPFAAGASPGSPRAPSRASARTPSPPPLSPGAVRAMEGHEPRSGRGEKGRGDERGGEKDRERERGGDRDRERERERAVSDSGVGVSLLGDKGRRDDAVLRGELRVERDEETCSVYRHGPSGMLHVAIRGANAALDAQGPRRARPAVLAQRGASCAPREAVLMAVLGMGEAMGAWDTEEPRPAFPAPAWPRAGWGAGDADGSGASGWGE